MNRFAYISSSVFLCMFPIIGSSQVSIGLEPGVTVEPSNINEIARTSVPYARIRKADRVYKGSDRSSSVAAFVGPIGGDKYFGLMRTGVLHAVDIPNDEYIGSWPLTRWEGEGSDEEVWAIYDMSRAPDGERWNQARMSGGRSSAHSIGCLADSPLRYGDVTGDGDQSIVIYLGQRDHVLDWLVFSPGSESLVFSARLALEDYFEPGEKYQDQYEIQYPSQAMETRATVPGRRVYAKLYIGDFRSDEEREASDEPVHEMIVWRKMYRSLDRSDSEEGFGLDEEILRRYRKTEDGAYERMSDSSESLRGVLSERDLTWPKGYPNYSECEDEEGQLIPEMHDPLLNDPDVLEGVDPETMTFVEEEED